MIHSAALVAARTWRAWGPRLILALGAVELWFYGLSGVLVFLMYPLAIWNGGWNAR